MRSRQLETALEEFVEQAALRLQAHIDAGEEVPFDLDSRSTRRGASPLYSYRPLTGAFVAERMPALRALPTHAKAEALLNEHDALDRYLARAGDGSAHAGARNRADVALLALLKEVFAEQTDFKLQRERLARALERLDGPLVTAAGELVTLVATLHGLAICSPELQLARGLSIVQPDALQGAPEQALPGVRAGDDHVLVAYTARELDPSEAIARGVQVVGELLRALRLFGDGRIALGARAFARVGDGQWSTVALGAGGHPHGVLLVTPEQEDELRAFCSLVSRRMPDGGPIAWALRRFDLGCDRPSELEGLSDHLLALRVLLSDPSEPQPNGAPDGLLAGRLAALCAVPERRAQLAERTLAALALEREAIAGTAVERAGRLTLAREQADHLRALLRDVLCGHLQPRLAELADRILIGEPEDERQSLEDRQLEGQLSLTEQQLGDESYPAEVLRIAV